MEDYICVLCEKVCKGYGNNAQPLKDGLCCDNCNVFVIRKRLSNIEEASKE